MSGNDENTLALLHGGGPDGSTGFYDFSRNRWSITSAGNVQIDTAQKVFSSGAILFDGAGDSLLLPDSSLWDFGTGNFSVDCRVRFAINSTFQTLLDIQNGDTNGCLLVMVGGLGLFRVRIVGVARDFSWTPAANIWYHLAVTRSGTDLKLFIDGTQQGGTLTDSGNITGGTDGVRIGRDNAGGAADMNGWLEEIRISNVARWTANFNPPAMQYTTDKLQTNILRPRAFGPGLAR